MNTLAVEKMISGSAAPLDANYLLGLRRRSPKQSSALCLASKSKARSLSFPALSEAEAEEEDRETQRRSGRAPLVDALGAAAEEDVACFGFPGHSRGRGAPAALARLIGNAAFSHDVFFLEDAVAEAQREAAALFGADETWFLVNGTTCGVQAAIMATCGPGETLILPRNAHISASSAMVMSGAVPRYLTPSFDPFFGIPGGISAADVAAAADSAARAGERLGAVLVTSPTFHGVCSDVAAMAEICRRHRVPLLVDEAHGGHFKFHRDFPSTALQQGADVAVQSTHKVLSSLTQSSMLHVAGGLVDRDRVDSCLQALQSSSPNHLLLASLDAARAELAENPARVFDGAAALAAEAARRLAEVPGVDVLRSGDVDPLRITVRVSRLGINGQDARRILEEDYRILSELAGARTVTIAVGLGTRPQDVDRLVGAVARLSLATGDAAVASEEDEGMERALFEAGEMALSPREAFFARKKKVQFRQSAGRVCGEFVYPFPPGIPLLMPGQVVTRDVIDYLLEIRENGALTKVAADANLSTIIVCDV